MPLKSKAQMRYLYAKYPKIAKEFTAETPDVAALPEKAKPKVIRRPKKK